MNGKYDTREARDLAGKICDELAPHTDARLNAARELFAALLTLTDVPGLDVRGHPEQDGGVILGLKDRGRGFLVAYDAEARVFQAGRMKAMKGIFEGDVVTLPLVFNPVLARFEGRDADAFIEPLPGQPRPRRSAVAVVVACVGELMRKG